MTKMRVTWVSLEWPREGHHSGGVGRYAARLAARVQELVDLTVITYAGAAPVPGVELVTIPPAGSRVERYYTSAWRAARALPATRPDVVHAHGDDFLLRTSAPIVRSFYGTSWGEAKSSTGLRKANHVVLAGAELWSAKRAQLRLGIAPESLEMFRCQHVFPPYLRQQRTTGGTKGAEPVVVFIGSFRGRKRGWMVQEAVEALRAEDDRVRLVVIGPADDAASWSPWVEHRAGLADSQVADVLGSAWVLASPSEYEGFGIPVLEGIDHGLRVVASSNPGSQYLQSRAEPGVPLDVVEDEAFGASLGRAVARGPVKSRPEREAGGRLVSDMAADGSPERLLSIYQEALRAAR
ncbi:glycosyltransferase family 4 protein [Nocardioides sp. ChNu-153]|uniref:glycosyltransferase family 4 protein n=1 Tax=unclassified Nocardioides TaxID=2615069 RepID=UPI00240673EE|nr:MULTISPECIES: glycosyltransferase family 4 protein [unclassified Nocardioides]MDF9715025.1 glycosyltransferase family 4 protein [Nocardioides sp. ChNu-99]MDN7122294.1 glycosyltransferase family 4 protein [Nocardioides sp. ChNu-153]